MLQGYTQQGIVEVQVDRLPFLEDKKRRVRNLNSKRRIQFYPDIKNWFLEVQKAAESRSL